MTAHSAWWRVRRDELLAVARERCPVCVYNEEIINEIFFDMLSVEAMDRLFYPVPINPYLEIVRKAHEMGAGLQYTSSAEGKRLLDQIPGLASQRLLFTPEAPSQEDYTFAFDRGDWVLVDDPAHISAYPGVFQGRGIIVGLHVDAKGRSGIGLGSSTPHGTVDFLLSAAFKARLEGLGMRVKGIRITGYAPPDIADIAALINAARERFPETDIISLGAIAGLPDKGEGVEDGPMMEEFFATIQDSHPDVRLWRELGFRAMAQAGGLLTRVQKMDHDAGNFCAGLDIEEDALAHFKGFEMDHDVFNLSKISEDQPMRFHFGGARGIQVTRKCRIISAHPVDIGDVLFISNTGATFPGPRHRDVSKRFLPEHYLKARKMCSVKI